MKKYLLILTACAAAISAAAQPLLRPDNIDEVLSAMSLEEKVALLVGGGKEFPGRAKGLPAGSTRAFERYGIPLTYLADGPAGVRVNHPCTGFTIGTLLASSWDTSLVEEVASAMGDEARAYDVGLLLAPGLNIHRNPLCGRNFEYFSEDPLLSGKMASAYVKGVQSHGVGATVKHFAANNQESLRTTLDVRIGERALREIYLKGFEIAVKEAAPWAVMASYNQINGDYTQQKKELLTGILREEWGFDGLVMTDWGFKAGTVKAVQAGNDLMEPGYDGEIRNILEAVKYGKLDVADIDRNARRVLEYIVKTPAFLGQPGSGAPDLEGHAKLSIHAATEGMILLKNDGILPLKAGGKIAVLDLSEKGFVAGGTGSGAIAKGGVTSLESALKKAGFEISQEADVAVVTIGRRAGEAKDRVIPDDFCLSEKERSLLEQACATYRKVVVVLNICGVVETASWKELPAAILLPWAPGRDGAYAVADVLSGKVNPSGKLPMTFPVDYWDDPSSANFPSDSASIKPFVNYEEGIYVGYRYYSTVGKAVSYPFGYGLSYTSFDYSKPKVKLRSGIIEARITVKNTGSVPGREVVQLYVSAPSGGLEKPVRELKAFAKTGLLAPGKKETLVLRLSPYDLASYNEATSAWETAAGKYEFLFGASVEDIRATAAARLKKPQSWPVKRRCAPVAPIQELQDAGFVFMDTGKEFAPGPAYLFNVLGDRHIGSDAFLDKYYEPLRAKYPDYITREPIGVDDSGKYTQWCYSFTPANYKKTVYLQAGVHGRNEFESYLAAALFMRMIADIPKGEEHLRYLRDNVRFIVVPLVNVYDASEWTYKPNNSANINLNRDWFDQRSQEVRNIKALLARYDSGEIQIALDLHTDPEGIPGWGAYLLPYADEMPAEISDRMVAVNNYLYDRNIPGKVLWEGKDLLKAFMGPKREYPSSSKEWRENHDGDYKRGTAWKSISSGIWKDCGIPAATLEHGARKFGPRGSAVEMARAVELYLNHILIQTK